MSNSLSVVHTDEIVKAEKIITAYPDTTTGCISSVPVSLRDPAAVSLKGDLRLKYASRGFSLTYCNERIRGVNYEPGHTNSDGDCVEGWHEHIWNGSNDFYVISIPEFDAKGRFHINMDVLLEVIMVRWYITFKGPFAHKLFT